MGDGRQSRRLPCSGQHWEPQTTRSSNRSVRQPRPGHVSPGLVAVVSVPTPTPPTHSVRTQCPSRSPAAPLPCLCRPGLWVPTPACGCQEPPGCRLPGGVTGGAGCTPRGSSSGRCLISGGAGDSRRGPMHVERASLWFRHSGLCRSRPNLWFQVRTGNRHAERACGVEAGPGGDWLGPRLAE